MAIESRYKKSIKNNFIGRDNLFEELDFKLKNIENEEYSILNYFGLGGIGKSTLIKEIEKRYKNDNNLIFSYNFDSSDKILDFYQDLLKFFDDNKIKTDYFSIAFFVYFARQQPFVTIKERLPFLLENEYIQEFFGENINKGVNEFIEETIDFVPFPKVFKSLSKLLFEKSKKINMDKGILQELEELKDLDIKEIERRLPYFLALDIKKYFEKNNNKKIIFLLDTYEKLWDSYRNDNFRFDVDDWITDIVSELDCTNALFIISGREDIKWEIKNIEWNQYISKRQLDIFTHEESVKLLSSAGVEERLLKKIADISGGYPFYLELFIEVYKKDKDKDNFDSLINKDKILERFKQNLSSNQVIILEKLSICRLFDKNLYEHLIKELGLHSEIFFKELTSYSFIEEIDDSYKIHNIVSESFKINLSQERQDKINIEIFDYYNKLIEDGKKEVVYYEKALFYLLNISYDRNKILEWFKNTKFHLIKNSEYENLILLYEKAIDLINETKDLYFEFQIELLELYTALKRYSEAKEIIEFLTDSNISDNLLESKNYYATYLGFKENQLNINKRKLSGNYQGKANKLLADFEDISKKSSSEDIKVRAIIQIAKIKGYLNQSLEAKTLLNESLIFCKNKALIANIYEDLASLCKQDYKSAKDYIEKALKIKKSLYNEMHLEMGKSYRELSKIIIENKDFKHVSEIVLKTIKIFSKYYKPDSSDILHEYSRLHKCLGEEYFLSCTELDYEAKYLTLIKFSKGDKRKIKQYISELLSISIETKKDEIETKIKISKSLPNKEEGLLYLEEISYGNIDNFDKYKIFSQIYYLKYYSKKEKEFNKDEEVFLEKLLKISKEVSAYKYIYELNRIAKFYKNQKLYDRVEKYYIEILKILKIDEYKNRYKIMNIYEDYRIFTVKIKDEKKFEDILEDETKFLEKYEQFHKLAKAIEMKNNFTKREENYFEVIAIYKKIEDYNRVDATYGKLIEYYEKNNELNKALEYYEKQIEIRIEQNQLEKLSRGYKYLAEFYLYKMNNPLKGKEILEKGFVKLIDAREHLSLDMMNIYLINMQNYYRKYLNEDEIKILELREKYFEDTNSNIKLNIYEDFVEYYEEKDDLENMFNYLKKAFNTSKSLKNSIKQIDILGKMSNILLNQNKYEQYLNILFEIYNLKILLKDNKSIELLEKIKDFNFKNNILTIENFIELINNILAKLLKSYNIQTYVDSIIILKDVKNINLFKFYIYNAKKSIKIVELIMFERIINLFIQKEEKILASFYYYEYIDRKLEKLKAQFDKQEEFYEESLSKMKDFGNMKLYKEHKLRYDKFKERMKRMNIINGRAVDGIILNTISKINPITIEEELDTLLSKLKEYTELFFKDEFILEKIKNKKLAQSVFVQGFYCLIKDFNFYSFGIINADPLIAYLLSDTEYCNVYINNAQQIIRRDDFEDSFVKTEDIKNFKLYIHDVVSYKILLNNMFFNKLNGIYFPQDEIIMKKVLFYLGSNNDLFINMRFQNIVESVIEKFDFKDNDIFRAKHIIKNLCELEILKEDFSYKNFEDKLFTLESDYNDIIIQLKERAKEILEKTLGNIDILNFEQIFLSFNTTKNILGENKL